LVKYYLSNVQIVYINSSDRNHLGGDKLFKNKRWM